MENQETGKRNIWMYLKNYRFNSLLIRNFLLVVVFAATPLLITVYGNYRNFSREMNQRMEESNMELLLKSSTVIDNMVSNVLTISDELLLTQEFQYLCEFDRRSSKYAENVVWMNTKIREYRKHYPYIKNIYLYSVLNDAVIDGKTLIDVKRFDGKGKWYDVYVNFPMEGPYTMIEEGDILFCTPLYQETQERAGLLVIIMDAGELGRNLESEEITPSRSLVMLDISKQIMYCSNGAYLTEQEMENYRNMIGKVHLTAGGRSLVENSKVVSVVASAHKSWRYALVTNIPLYTEELAKLRNFLISSVLTGLLPSLLAAYLITFITYRPVKKIIKIIEKPQEYIGNEDKGNSTSEMLYITSNILNTLSKNEKMENELEERIRALNNAQLQALQCQMDPHFLYNTLEMIKWMASEDMGSGNRTSKLIAKMAKLYRIGLQSQNMILTLKEEIEFLQLYIEILEVRYSGKVHFVWMIDEEFYECKVIKFCIQPLIENAVKHGLKPRRYNGTIWIMTERIEGKLCIYVENDGVEMPDSEIQSLNQMLAKRNEIGDSKIGLLNINERIKILYGLEYGVSVEKRGEERPGMRIKLTFPYVRHV